MSTTTTAPSETTVTLRETDLLEAGIVALESGDYEQCIGDMRDDGNVRCAEGVLAEVLIAAYPEWFCWGAAALWDFREGMSLGELEPGQWRLLHPRGPAIAAHAAYLLDSYSLVDANDIRGIPFSEIAAALRRAKAEIEAGALD